MNRFDALHCLLEGNHLIESSAGTGKTHTISSLYLRLLLEKKLPPGRILVVTFTEAATRDLNRRIRERIVEALEIFKKETWEQHSMRRQFQGEVAGQSPAPTFSAPCASDAAGTKDEFLEDLAKTFRDRGSEACRLLELALRSFDEAAIFTIHGFCQRTLQEHAFESGSRFDTELLTDQQGLLAEVLSDFWRMNFPGASSTFIGFSRRRKLSMSGLTKLAETLIRHPDLKILPEQTGYSATEEQQLEEQFLRCFQEAARQWREEQDSVRKLLESSPALNRTKYNLAKLPSLFQGLDLYFLAAPRFPEGFEKLASSSIAAGTKARQASPGHPFFLTMEKLIEAGKSLEGMYEKKWIELRKELAAYLKREMKRRKSRQNLRGYDDLLLDLEEALEGPAGDSLIQVVGERYPAALIDEFQDTDPVQYRIFQKLYDGKRGALFLIGDPKQAIYRFRGADVFTYLEAYRKTRSRHTLDRNWRSSGRLIQAVNTLFSSHPFSFVFPEIQFVKVKAGKEAASRGLLQDGEPDAHPLRLWLVAREEEGRKPLTKGEGDMRIPAAVAGEIARLLESGLKGTLLVEGRPLSARDLAVLVPTNAKARCLHEALARVRIPAVIYGTDSVFATEEAEELRRILLAISEPAREGWLQAALVTRAIGLEGRQLLEEFSSESQWEAILEEFSHYREQWLRHGFMPMARRLLSRRRVRQNLLRMPDGERRLTNLLHCLELIQQAVSSQQLGLEGVLKWLAERKTEEEGIPPEEYQVRLETDEDAVQVITVHRSKGLEYPVVFCPYAWLGKKPPEELPCHDPSRPEEVFLDLRSEGWLKDAKENELEEGQRVRHLQYREQLAESARLLYVALTRAKYRCYLAWGNFADAGWTALAFLLHPAGAWEGERPILPHPRLAAMTDGEIREELADLTDRSERSIRVELIPPPFSGELGFRPAGLELLPSREFRGPLTSDWGVSSFTSLVSRRTEDAELPDRDAAGASLRSPLPFDRPVPENASLAGFPGGVRAGIFLHSLLERLDFSRADSPETSALVDSALREHGYRTGWRETILALLRRIMALPLEGANTPFRLGDLGQGQRRAEVEFTLPMGRLSPERLRRLFEREDLPGFERKLPEALEQLDFRPARGLMHGFIDLVLEAGGRYYLLDWKSNFLGPEPRHYSVEALRETIRREFYFLQYCLYTVAWHRHLQSRLPEYDYEKHFGGVFYLFLRGIDLSADNGCGVWFDRPPARVVQALSELLGSD